MRRAFAAPTLTALNPHTPVNRDSSCATLECKHVAFRTSSFLIITPAGTGGNDCERGGCIQVTRGCVARRLGVTGKVRRSIFFLDHRLCCPCAARGGACLNGERRGLFTVASQHSTFLAMRRVPASARAGLLGASSRHHKTTNDLRLIHLSLAHNSRCSLRGISSHPSAPPSSVRASPSFVPLSRLEAFGAATCVLLTSGAKLMDSLIHRS